MDRIHFFHRTKNFRIFKSGNQDPSRPSIDHEHIQNTDTAAGFVTVTTIFLTTLIAIILLAGSQIIHLIRLSEAPLFICRDSLLSSQGKVANQIEKLISLNPIVFELRQETVLAKSALVAAIATDNPVAIVEAKNWLKLIAKKKSIVRSEQKAFIDISISEMHLGLQMARTKINSQNTEFKDKLKSLWNVDIYQIRTSNPQLAVKPDIADDLPAYSLKNDFSREQKLQMSWITKISFKNEGFQKWIQPPAEKTHLCTATLQGNPPDIRPVLSAAKF